MEAVFDKSRSVIIGYKYNLANGKQAYFKSEEIIPIMRFNPMEAYPSQTRGYSEVEACAVAIDTDNAQSVWNWKEFENGATPGTVLSTDKSMSPENIERVQNGWMNKFRGVNNAKKLAILTDGLKMEHATLSPKDMDFIEGKRLSRDEILAIFKVPKAILGLGDGAGGNMNIRSYQEIFARNALLPVSNNIRDAFNKYLFSGIGYFEFYNIIPNDETIVRADYQSGIITLNEARGMRGMQPVKNGDAFIYDDTTVTVSPTLDTEDATKIVTKSLSYTKILDDLAESLVPNSEKAMILKVKRRDKRLTKYEKQIEKAVADIARQQENEILAGIKDTKALDFPKIDF